MKLINNLTTASKQQVLIVGDNGEVITLKLYFMPTQSAWMFDLEYLDFILKGAFLTCMPNLLLSYKRILNFGLMCISSDGYEPQFITDFAEGRVSIYWLNADEVIELDEAELA